jgi:hypothetical protein
MQNISLDEEELLDLDSVAKFHDENIALYFIFFFANYTPNSS